MLNRFVIPTIEGRIFTGVVMFVAVMILIGWVAINEPARMASFVEQHNGRSIERGAELYASRCSTCHGTDGLGIAERAPALNNPHLFGFNYLQTVNNEILPRERLLAELNGQLEDLEEERAALTTEAGNADLTDARRQEITTRLAEIDVLTGVEGETALAPRITTVQAELEPFYTERDLALDGLQSAIDAGYLPELDAARAEGGLALTNYLNQDANRLSQVGWASDVSSYFKTTLIHGRPGSENVWPAPMVSWSQLGGGPLREDQIDDIVAFLVNYNKGDAWTLEDLASVQQFAKLHGGGEAAPAVPPVGSNVDAALPIVEPMVGDPVRGEALYAGTQRTETGDRLGCSSCHAGGAQAPATEGTWERVETERLPLAEFAGYTAEHYLIESIIAPDVYVVPGYASGVMPNNLGENMSAKDLADLIEYLHSTSPGYVAPDPSTITPLTQPGAAMPAAPAAMGTAEAGMTGETSTNAPMAEATAEATVPVMVEPEGSQPDLPTPEATTEAIGGGNS